jgi:hypothetical protein
MQEQIAASISVLLLATVAVIGRIKKDKPKPVGADSGMCGMY